MSVVLSPTRAGRHRHRGPRARRMQVLERRQRCRGTCTPAADPTLTFAAYSTPREAYGKIIPAFRSKWKEDTTTRT